ncbi:hypothetical protein Syun_012799 [Stephania yunnanensis]|uniref:Uncharacterized protein n=1 Tax=Stephania yunnanensis TaxID=152371 RepID=A0AAP0K0X3_9MAGN
MDVKRRHSRCGRRSRLAGGLVMACGASDELCRWLTGDANERLTGATGGKQMGKSAEWLTSTDRSLVFGGGFGLTAGEIEESFRKTKKKIVILVFGYRSGKEITRSEEEIARSGTKRARSERETVRTSQLHRCRTRFCHRSTAGELLCVAQVRRCSRVSRCWSAPPCRKPAEPSEKQPAVAAGSHLLLVR